MQTTSSCGRSPKKKIQGVVKALVHGDDEVLDLNTLKKKFSGAPLEQVAKLAVRRDVKSTDISWNGRMRRSVVKADYVVLNLFSGPDLGWWTKQVPAGWVVLNVDILQNPDMLKDATMAYLINVARSGKVKTFLAGPPFAGPSQFSDFGRMAGLAKYVTAKDLEGGG